MIVLQNLMWFFIIIFMIHEFEEIIFMRRWLKENESHILKRFPKTGKKFMAQNGDLSTEAFSLIVAEEFLIVSGVVTYAVMTANYELFTALAIVYMLHLLVHIAQSIALQKYVPALFTSILTGAISLYIIIRFFNEGSLSISQIMIYSLLLFVFVIINLKGMYGLINKIKI